MSGPSLIYLLFSSDKVVAVSPSTVSEYKAEERESAKGMHGVLAGICPSLSGNSLSIRVFLVSLARLHEDKGRKSFTLCVIVPDNAELCQ